MRVQQGQTRRHHIDERCDTARTQHTPHFAQCLSHVAPMVGRIAADHCIHAARLEREALGDTVERRYLRQPSFDRSRRNDLEHVGRQIVGHHLGHQRRKLETHMPGTTPQVEQSPVAMTRQASTELGKLGTLCMHIAVQIGLRLLPELRSDMFAQRRGIRGFGGPIHCSAPNNHGWRARWSCSK